MPFKSHCFIFIPSATVGRILLRLMASCRIMEICPPESSDMTSAFTLGRSSLCHMLCISFWRTCQCLGSRYAHCVLYITYHGITRHSPDLPLRVLAWYVPSQETASKLAEQPFITFMSSSWEMLNICPCRAICVICCSADTVLTSQPATGWCCIWMLCTSEAISCLGGPNPPYMPD